MSLICYRLQFTSRSFILKAHLKVIRTKHLQREVMLLCSSRVHQECTKAVLLQVFRHASSCPGEEDFSVTNTF